MLSLLSSLRLMQGFPLEKSLNNKTRSAGHGLEADFCELCQGVIREVLLSMQRLQM